MKVAGVAYRQCNSHFISRDGIHRTADKRRLEHDVSGNATFCDDIVGREIDLPWEHKEVVIGKAAMDGCVHELVDRQAIWGGIFIELIERL